MSNTASATESWSFGDKELGDAGGEWIAIDAPRHPAFANVVWRMEDDDRSPECEARAQVLLAAHELLAAARPLVAMTFAEARAAEDRGERLLYCQHDVLNPCWSGSWSAEHGPGKHWGGGDACPECSLRAAIAKATGGAA